MPFGPAMQVQGPKSIEKSTRFLKPSASRRVSMNPGSSTLSGKTAGDESAAPPCSMVYIRGGTSQPISASVLVNCRRQ